MTSTNLDGYRGAGRARIFEEKQCRRRLRWRKDWSGTLTMVVLLLVLCASSVRAAYVEFHNCLDSNIVDSSPRILQFDPLNVSAVFNSSSTSDRHHLNITIYGNVTGKATEQPYPPPDDPSWNDPNDTFGKIPDLSESNNKYTTLFAHVNFLGYTPWNADPSRFCESVVQGECPLAPAFFVNQSDLDRLSAFSVAHDLSSSYAFASLQATLRVQSGDANGQYYSCVTATITPDLGGSLNAILRFVPLVVLIVVGVATIAAAILSPWGSVDLFHWSSNFGRDEDLLRLVTPGFGDCLQYVQFVVLTGSLSLNYPGFYQPAVSRVSWSSLMFNESFVTGGNGTQSVVDGIYEYRQGTKYGLDRMSQLVGMTSDKDVWADMIVWLVVIVAAVSILTQMGFAVRWIYRKIKREPPEDLRSKNGPFTAGNVVRLVMNFFLLPLASLSFYQLLIAGKGPAYSVALAAVALVVVIAFLIWVLLLFVRTRPRSFLFDDFLMVLAYGPLYNTYCDDAATFALIPLVVNFVRGIAIGGVQPSGIAQIVLLAICEIVLILTINAFRPFPSATSMNIYHTCFSVIRLITILLSIAFVPTLDVGDSSRGWIGYAILIIHACTMVFGFFLNAVQTLVEVIARLAGAGGRDEATGAATRGGLNKVFGMRQLSRRMPRRATQDPRHSMSSNAAMLNTVENDHQKLQMAKTRSRSVSAASGVLLESGVHSNRISQNLDGRLVGNATPDRSSRGSRRLTVRLSGAGSLGGIVGIQRQVEQKDPYYRPPRRNTMDALAGADSRPDLAQASLKGAKASEGAVEDDVGEGPSTPMPVENDDFEDISNDLTRTKTDYAVREVDFYYGVRGAALSNSGTRKLKTGPADPTGPVSTATGWFKNLLGGKTKEKNKGFEVVRSARAPPPGLFPPPAPVRESQVTEPYHDDVRSVEESQTDQNTVGVSSPPPQPKVQRQSHHQSVYDDISVAGSDDDEENEEPESPVSARPPSLPLIESVGGIELPSRIGSEASRKSRGKPPRAPETDIPAVPAIPRKSSRRQSGGDSGDRGLADSALSTLRPADFSSRKAPTSTLGTSRIPFANTQPSTFRNKRYSTGAESTTSSVLRDGDENATVHPSYTTQMRQSATSALGTHGADLRNERPSNMGFVQQHRASDHIHQSPDSPEFEGSTAEVHGRPAY
ncbi:integral membrane protein [Fonsecaea pedrosoi]|nr:integral membrane protein [Fonsecaea pedrosoi]